MNTQSLTQSLLSELQQGGTLQQVSRQLNLDPGSTSQAVSNALPLLLGGLSRNASQPQGAEALFGALQRDHRGISMDLSGLLSQVNGGRASPATNGAGILGHVFGGQTPQAASLLGQKTGLGGEKSGQLLTMLAPIVMAFLAQRFAQQGSSTDLSQALGEETRQTGGGGISDLLGSVLDQDGDGKLGISDLAGLLGGKR